MTYPRQSRRTFVSRLGSMAIAAMFPGRSLASGIGPRSHTAADFPLLDSRLSLAASGIRRGDHVALLCPNLPYFPAVYFGILKTGATVVPLNVLLKPREIAYHLRDSDAKAIR